MNQAWASICLKAFLYFIIQIELKFYEILQSKSHHFPQTNLGTHYNLSMTQVCFSDETLKNILSDLGQFTHDERELPPQQPVDLEQTGTETTVVEIVLYPQLLKYNVHTKVFPLSPLLYCLHLLCGNWSKLGIICHTLRPTTY